MDLRLEGADEIDWVAAYSALEVIARDLRARGLDGQAIGWWTGAELKRFTGTANSLELSASAPGAAGVGTRNPFELRARCQAAFPGTLPVSSVLGRPEAAGQDIGQIERGGLLELRVAA